MLRSETIANYRKKRALPAEPSSSTAAAGAAAVRCTCKRSKCLKRYCECFAADVACSSACKCLDCGNVEEFSAERKRKRQAHSQALRFLEKKRRAPLSQLEATDAPPAEETPATVTTTPKTSLESEAPKPVAQARPVTPANAGLGEHTIGSVQIATSNVFLAHMAVIGGQQVSALLVEALRNVTAPDSHHDSGGLP